MIKIKFLFIPSKGKTKDNGSIKKRITGMDNQLQLSTCITIDK